MPEYRYKNLRYVHRTARWFECLTDPTPENVEDFQNTLRSIYAEVADCYNRRQLNIKFDPHSGTHINKMLRVLESPHVHNAISNLPLSQKQMFLNVSTQLTEHLVSIKDAGYGKTS